MTGQAATSLFLLLTTLVGGCASSAQLMQASASQHRKLTESQALTVIESVVFEQGAVPARSFLVETAAGNLLADVRVTGSQSAIEWVSEEDRTSEAKNLPTASPDDPLQIVAGRAEAREAQVLVLDADAYGYEANPHLVQRGATSISDAEARLRRDVGEYLEYLRLQGVL